LIVDADAAGRFFASRSAALSPSSPYGPQMFKFLLSTAGILMLIGLLVVIGLLALIF
jgi:hypothetical protein